MDFRKNLPFKSYGVKKPICKLDRAHREPFSPTFGINGTQEQLERQLVSRKLLQALSTGATCQRPARYSVLHTPRWDRVAMVCLLRAYTIMCMCVGPGSVILVVGTSCSM